MEESLLQKALRVLHHGGAAAGITSLAVPALTNPELQRNIESFYSETNIINSSAAVILAAGISGMALRAEQINHRTYEEFSRLRSLAAFTGDSQMRFEHLLDRDNETVEAMLQLVEELRIKMESE